MKVKLVYLIIKTKIVFVPVIIYAYVDNCAISISVSRSFKHVLILKGELFF